MTTKQERHLRKLVESSLGAPVPNIVWADLLTSGDAEDAVKEGALAEDADALDDLVQAAGYMGRGRRLGVIASGRKKDNPPVYQPTPKELLHHEALTEFLRARVSGIRPVTDFRRSLPAELLTIEDAWRFLRSPLAQLFSFQELADCGANPFTDRGRVVSQKTVVEANEFVENWNYISKYRAEVAVWDGSTQKSDTPQP